MTAALKKIIQTLTIQELVETQAEIREIITSKKNEERSKLLLTFRELAEKSGLTIEEIFGVITPASMKQKKGTRPPVEQKYRNPDPNNKNETWSGRGHPPVWAQQFLDNKGWRSLEEDATVDEQKANKDKKTTILKEILIKRP